MASEALKKFVRKKLEEGISPEELRTDMEKVGLDTGALDEIMAEVGQAQFFEEQEEAQSGIQEQEETEEAQSEQVGQITESAPQAQAEEKIAVPAEISRRTIQQAKQKEETKSVFITKKKVFVFGVIAIIIGVSILIFLLSQGLMVNIGILQNFFGAPQNQVVSQDNTKIFLSGLKQLEFKEGTITGYAGDQNHAFFSLVFQYNKTVPLRLDLNSIKISKPGQACNTTTIPRRITKMIDPRNASETTFAQDWGIDLKSGGIANIHAIAGGENCGPRSMDYNYEISFYLSSGTGQKTFEKGMLQGKYALLQEKDELYYQNLGYYDFMTKNFDEAEKNYLKGLEKNPKSEDMTEMLVLVYSGKNDYNKTAGFIDSIIEANPQNAWLHFSGGIAHLKLKNYEKAREYFNNILAIDPSNSFATGLILDSYDTQQKYAEGQLFAELLALQHPKDFMAHYYAGYFSEKLRQIDKAEASLKKALELNPKDYPTITLLGTLYTQQKKFLELEEMLKNSIIQFPEDPVLLYRLGYAQYELEKTSEAIATLEKSVSIKPDNADAWLLLFYSYERTSQREKMREAIEKYSELTGTAP